MKRPRAVSLRLLGAERVDPHMLRLLYGFTALRFTHRVRLNSIIKNS